jgi:hypothetical protein
MTTELKKEIQKLARESVREALQNEFNLISILDIPVASQKEQQEIARLYKKPSRRGVRTLRIKI